MAVDDPWNPAQYDRFRAERQQPFADLMALVDRRPAMRIVDLGCGTGELTARLHRELDARETLGIDGSPEMLARHPAASRLRFTVGDIAAFADSGCWDLVFSNAALQWVDDHPALFRRLRDALVPGGQLAVQMPANASHPSHAAIVAVAAEPRFVAALGGWQRRTPVLAPEEYAALLAALGAGQQHVRLQVYGHWLGSRDDVIEWTKGTTLSDYRRRLGDDDYAAFLARYREVLLPQLPDDRPFFYPFRRLLIWAAF